MSDGKRLCLRKRLCLLALCAAFLLVGARDALACSCAPQPTVLESYESAEVIVGARVASVEKTDEGRHVDGIKSARMIVEKSYKGRLRAGDEMIFGQGGGADCVWTFHEDSVGRQYLFYLRAPTRESKLWYAVTCDRSTNLAGAADDLNYLNNLDKLRGKTDERGRFSLKLLKGQRGRLAGSIYAYAGQFESCPQLEAIFRQTGKAYAELSTPAVEIAAEHGLAPAELRLPFPACKRSK